MATNINEKAVVYAALILADDGVEITVRRQYKRYLLAFFILIYFLLLEEFSLEKDQDRIFTIYIYITC